MAGLGSGKCSFTALQWTVCSYIRKAQMPIVKHSEALAALVAFHESKWWLGGRFCSLNKNLKHKLSKNLSNALSQHTRKKKSFVALHIGQTGTKACRNPGVQQRKWMNCVIFRCIWQQEVSVLGWAKFLMKSWFMHRQCCMMAVPHPQRWWYHQFVFILVDEVLCMHRGLQILTNILIEIIMEMKDLHGLTIVYNYFIIIPCILRNCIQAVFEADRSFSQSLLPPLLIISSTFQLLLLEN